ncbi:MAG: hypothetical protein KM296_08545 [Brockia lithotrophica]|nr:hypothetical protein [Brockia lithotrophica]MBT9253710.1 hypothetical protein [Brockia lithotrophica]
MEDDLRSEVHGLLLAQLRWAKRAVEGATVATFRHDLDLARRTVAEEEALQENSRRLEEVALRALTVTKSSDKEARWWITAGKLARSLRRLGQFGVYMARRLPEGGSTARLTEEADVTFPRYVRVLLRAAEEIVEAFLVAEATPLLRVREEGRAFGFFAGGEDLPGIYGVFLVCAGEVVAEMYEDVRAYLAEAGRTEAGGIPLLPARDVLTHEVGKGDAEEGRGEGEEDDDVWKDED